MPTQQSGENAIFELIGFAPKDPTNAVMSGVHFAIVPCKTGSFEMEVKCKEIYISPFGTNDYGGAGKTFVNGVYGVAAELTGVPASEMYALTGSGISVSHTSNGVI